MKAADYLSQKSARKRRMRTERIYGPKPFYGPPRPSTDPRVEVRSLTIGHRTTSGLVSMQTPTSITVSGTTDDIDTPEKRAAIALAVLGHFGIDVDPPE